MPTATRNPSRTRAASTAGRKTTKAPTEGTDRLDADTLIDSLVENTPAASLAFLEQLAAERARAQDLGMFKLWSIRNRCALETQARRRGNTARRMFAGTKQWEENLGRIVRPEELDKPFYIQGARAFSYDVEDDNTGETVTRTGVRLAGKLKVYDWTQTVSLDENNIEPDWEVPVAAGNHTTLRQLAASSEHPVAFANLGGAASHAAFDGTTITIDDSIPVGNQIFALATALAHRVMATPLNHGAAPTATERAALADDVALTASQATIVGWIVARALGLDEASNGAVTQLAQDYLHNWTKINPDGTTMELAGIKSRRKRLTARLEDTLKVADAVLAGYTKARTS